MKNGDNSGLGVWTPCCDWIESCGTTPCEWNAQFEPIAIRSSHIGAVLRRNQTVWLVALGSEHSQQKQWEKEKADMDHKLRDLEATYDPLEQVRACEPRIIIHVSVCMGAWASAFR